MKWSLSLEEYGGLPLIGQIVELLFNTAYLVSVITIHSCNNHWGGHSQTNHIPCSKSTSILHF